MESEENRRIQALNGLVLQDKSLASNRPRTVLSAPDWDKQTRIKIAFWIANNFEAYIYIYRERERMHHMRKCIYDVFTTHKKSISEKYIHV